MSAFRLNAGGALIDRGRMLNFTFEGRRLTGFAGDTLASALLANGVSVVGRSFKYHRPRGIVAAGVEEPNALMQLETGARADTNAQATGVALYEGLAARAVNCWPSVDFDLGAINNALSRFFPAGFYYKTFLWPNWKIYEPIIRRAAGLGRVSNAPDPDAYDHRFAHCDVLVVGGGPAGLEAARAAQAAGARVMLVEQDCEIGGSLRWRGGVVEGRDAESWLRDVGAELRGGAETRVLTDTTAIGYFDHNSIALIERTQRDPGAADAGAPRQRFWQVRAKQVVLASGAVERPLVFGGNDRPGVMLASAVGRYLGDFGVLCGREAVYFTNNDSAYASAQRFIEAGGRIAAIVDTRATLSAAALALKPRAALHIAGGAIVSTSGAMGVRQARIRDAQGRCFDIDADLIAMSGGWTPTIHLHCQSGGKPKWDERLAALLPGEPVQDEISAGACAGDFTLEQALGGGREAGARAAGAAGYEAVERGRIVAQSTVGFDIEPAWTIPGEGKAFVDFQNDVTQSDIELAQRENFVSVEHLKRYTALGMGTDQGKTSNVNALALMGRLRGLEPSQSGVTRYRFPFTPVAIGAFAGVERGETFRPYRRMPLHEWHRQAGAAFEEYGTWMRPAHYLRPGETPRQAEQREALAVRSRVGIFEGSPLGKIEVTGPDAATFLDRMYANRMSDLAVGKCRYGLMLNELGVITDDGVCARLAEDRFLVGTTSAGASRIAGWLEEWLQCEWVKLEVLVAPVTHCWGVVTITGPKARDVLLRAGVDIDVGAEAFPHLSWRRARVAGVDARVFRVSYTGEVSYEINAAPSDMNALWRACLEAGAEFDITPVGIDAWDVLRTERGFLHVGADTDGTTSALDVGWERILKRKGDFVGRRSLMRPVDRSEERLNFVGIEPLNADDVLRVGLPVLVKSEGLLGKWDGCVTSACFSPMLQRHVGLGMVRNGRRRIGEIVRLAAERGEIAVRIAAPGAFDPKGERVHG